MPTAKLKVFLKCSNPLGGQARSNVDIRKAGAKGLDCLPMEVRLAIYQHLSARDKINTVLALFEIPTDDIESLTHWRSPLPRKLSRLLSLGGNGGSG